MGSAIESLRHPRVDIISSVWRSLASAVDARDDTISLDIPDSPTANQIAQYGMSFDKPAANDVRVLVLNAGIQALAKSLEANQGARQCRDIGATASGLLLSYDAAYLAARAFCLLTGFAPVNRESSVSVDVLVSYGSKSTDITEDNFSYFNFGRWSHSNIWALAGRLSRTLKHDEIESHLKVLRSDKLTNVTRIRNSQIYGSGPLYNGDDPEHADFPDLLFMEDLTNVVICGRYLSIFRSLVAICMLILREAQLLGELGRVACADRQLLAA